MERTKLEYKNLEELQQLLCGVLQDLTPLEQQVISLRFGLNSTYTLPSAQVEKQLNITRDEVLRIEAKTLRRIRRAQQARKEAENATK